MGQNLGGVWKMLGDIWGPLICRIYGGNSVKSAAEIGWWDSCETPFVPKYRQD